MLLSLEQMADDDMVTTLYAGILGLFYMGLTLFVVAGRIKNRVSLGDGDNDNLKRRIRIHGNFIEYTPIILLLMFLSELEGAKESILHITGVILIIARIMHVFGIYKTPALMPLRSGGTVLTALILAGLSIYCIQSYFIF